MNRAKSSGLSGEGFNNYEIHICCDCGRSFDRQIIGALITNDVAATREAAPEPKLRLPAASEATGPHMVAYGED